MALDVAPNPTRSPAARALLWLEGVLAVGAYGGGVALILGAIDLGGTDRLPFDSLVFAGIALIVVNGMLPTAVLVGEWRQRRWAARGHLGVGGALMGWIVVQVVALGPPVHWLQVLYFAWGAVIAALGWRQRSR